MICFQSNTPLSELWSLNASAQVTTLLIDYQDIISNKNKHNIDVYSNLIPVKYLQYIYTSTFQRILVDSTFSGYSFFSRTFQAHPMACANHAKANRVLLTLFDIGSLRSRIKTIMPFKAQHCTELHIASTLIWERNDISLYHTITRWNWKNCKLRNFFNKNCWLNKLQHRLYIIRPPKHVNRFSKNNTDTLLENNTRSNDNSSLL